MFHCKTPEYLSNILETQTSKDGTQNTRSNNSIREIFARTKLYYESFFPITIRLWNTLPIEIQNNPSLNNFKKYLNRSNINIPDYYNFGSRKGQILHSQLRLECSALKLYMFRRNICPSPLCTCGSIESNDHYLLYCPNYNVIRSETINKLPILAIIIIKTFFIWFKNLSSIVNDFTVPSVTSTLFFSLNYIL